MHDLPCCLHIDFRPVPPADASNALRHFGKAVRSLPRFHGPGSQNGTRHQRGLARDCGEGKVQGGRAVWQCEVFGPVPSGTARTWRPSGAAPATSRKVGVHLHCVCRVADMPNRGAGDQTLGQIMHRKLSGLGISRLYAGLSGPGPLLPKRLPAQALLKHACFYSLWPGATLQAL